MQTTEGALTAIPLGLDLPVVRAVSVGLASLRQSIALPEMVIWWAAFPLLVLGLCFALRHRLRQVAPIVMFTTMLTLAYSVFQGNVGTAYRQRSQLLVFYFIFVAVGAVLLRSDENARRKQGSRNRTSRNFKPRASSRAAKAAICEVTEFVNGTRTTPTHGVTR